MVMPNELPAQTYKNHTKIVPLFHRVLLPLLGVNFVWAVVGLVRHPSVEMGREVLVAACLVMIALFARVFALAVQDRVIRLEMRLLMREICPADLNARFGEFTPAQLVALRFASDAELPALARKVLDERLNDRKAIKLMVKNWKADNQRA
jgi:hypothetical protein